MRNTDLKNIERHFPSILDYSDYSKCKELLNLLNEGYGVINPIKSIEVDGEVVDYEKNKASFKEQQRLWEVLRNQANRCLRGDISELKLNVRKIMGNNDSKKVNNFRKFLVGNIWK